MIRATDVHSLTDFTRNARAYIRHIRENQSPMVITVNGAAEVVVHDARAFQQMVDELEHLRFIAAMRDSEAAVRTGQVQDLDQAFAELRDTVGR